MTFWLRLLPLLALACGASGPPLCITGSTNACTCANGTTTGVQVCDSSGAYGSCSCGAAAGGCTFGALNACTCAGGAAGSQSCGTDGAFGACACGQACAAGARQTCTCADSTAGEQLCGTDRTFFDCICASSKRIFVTQSHYHGNLGGLAGADAKCATSAAAVNLPGTFKAWLSTSTVNAIDRISDVGPWYFVGVPVKPFNNKANLMTVPLKPVAVNERGDVLSTSQYGVWSGTTGGGMKSGTSTQLCRDWTEASSSGQYGASGDASRTDEGWTYADNVVVCGETLRLYCIQQ